MRIRRFSMRFLGVLALSKFVMAAMFALAAHARVTTEQYEALGLPVLEIITENGRRIASKERYLTAEFRLTGGGEDFSGACKVRGHGNSTWKTVDTSKKPYLLKLDAPAPLLGMASAQKWVLLANATDKSFLRNEFALALGRTVFTRTGWVPRERFITLVVNGRYEGLYCLSEKVEQVDGRLVGGGDDGIFLALVDSHLGKEWSFYTARGVPLNITGSDQTPESAYRAAQSLLQHIEDVLFSPDFADPVHGYAAYIDVPSFVDWYIVNEFTKNHDARFQASCFMHWRTDAPGVTNAGELAGVVESAFAGTNPGKTAGIAGATESPGVGTAGAPDAGFAESPGGKLFMGPLWDFDISCGNSADDGCDRADGLIVSSRHWYKRLFEDPAFAAAVGRRWVECRGGVEEALAQVQPMADSLAPAANLNDVVWRTFGHRQWPNAPGWRGRRTYQAEVDYLTGWLTVRYAWFDAEFGRMGDSTPAP